MRKIIDRSIIKTISKEIMEQYEIIRQSGATNMFDYYNVIRCAKILNLKKLAKVSLEDYKILLLNFQKLMKHYDIKQPKNKIKKI